MTQVLPFLIMVTSSQHAPHVNRVQNLDVFIIIQRPSPLRQCAFCPGWCVLGDFEKVVLQSPKEGSDVLSSPDSTRICRASYLCLAELNGGEKIKNPQNSSVIFLQFSENLAKSGR